jgi:hypothetical protein
VVALPLVMEVGVIVLEIRPEKLAHYREIISAIDVPMERKDEMIKTLASLMQSFVDAAFGVDPVQIIERAKLKDSFQNAADHGKLAHRRDATQIDLFADQSREGATTQNKTENKGCAPWSRHI